MFLLACNQQDNIIGEWKVNSKFYQATFEIMEENDTWNGLVVYYNDGTTKYMHNDTKSRYAFTGLKKEKEVYVDGITAATSKKGAPKSVEIRKQGKDSLEVTTYIMNKPIVEVWTRSSQ